MVRMRACIAGIFEALSPSRTVTGRVASSKAMAPKRSAIPPPSAPKPGCTAFFLGRPFGLPDVPFLNWCSIGGLRYLLDPVRLSLVDGMAQAHCLGRTSLLSTHFYPVIWRHLR